MTAIIGYVYSIYFNETNEIWYAISIKKIKVFIDLILHNPSHLLFMRLLTEKYEVNIEFSCEIQKTINRIKQNNRFNLYPLKCDKLHRIILNVKNCRILNVIKTRTINIKRISTIKEPSQKYLKNKKHINEYALNRYYENKDEILRQRKMIKFNCICGCTDLNWFYRASHFNTTKHKINIRQVFGFSDFHISPKKDEKRIKTFCDCICGKKYEKYSATTHTKSQYHINYVNEKYRTEIVIEKSIKPKISKEKRQQYNMTYRLKQLEKNN